ncbi:MAG: molybdopterin-dependent oxidoreductase, partial [Nitrospirota bacterium]
VGWEEALDFVVKRLKEIKEEYGPDSIGGLSSAKCTNEENYLFQKFMRAAIGTNNVDHCARLCHSPSTIGLGMSLGTGAMTNSTDDFLLSDAIFVIGSNTIEAHPVAALKLKKAVREKGAKLIVADPRKIELVKFATVWLPLRPGTNSALLNGLAHVMLNEGLINSEFIEAKTENYDAFKAAIGRYTPELVEKLTGVPKDRIIKAARIYGSAERGSIFYGMGITQHTTGTETVLALANLALMTGHIGKEGTGVNPLRGQNNVQGACDMGALPNVYPGYQKVDDPAARKKFEDAWGVSLNEKPGLFSTEMINSVLAPDEKKHIRAMYIMGENPLISDPDYNHT